MIKVLSYKRGKLRKTDFNKLNLLREVCWIDVVSPDSKELKKISNKLGISTLDLENSLDKRGLPRVFNRKDYSGFIFRAPTTNNTLPFGVFLTKKFIITVRNAGLKSVTQFSNKLIAEDENVVFQGGTTGFAYNLISFVAKEYSTIFNDIEDKLEKIENKIIKSRSEDLLHSVFTLKRSLLVFMKSLKENVGVVSRIEESQLKFIQLKDKTLFSNLHVEISQLVSVAELYRERITSVTDMYMSNISNRLNDVMKSFAVIASLLLLPTLLSGIWGMNFARIPWYNHPYGFYFPIALMILSMIVLFVFFKS